MPKSLVFVLEALWFGSLAWVAFTALRYAIAFLFRLEMVEVGDADGWKVFVGMGLTYFSIIVFSEVVKWTNRSFK